MFGCLKSNLDVHLRFTTHFPQFKGDSEARKWQCPVLVGHTFMELTIFVQRYYSIYSHTVLALVEMLVPDRKLLIETR